MAVRIVLNSKGIQALLTDEKVAADLHRRATAVAQAADAATGRAGDHGVEVSIGRRRARAAVFTQTFNAMHREAESRTLTRSLDAGRA
jgi:hypothetical protein